MFDGLPPGAAYDAILANPPYVDPARIKEVQPSVLEHEPRVALFGGKKGMEVIKKFLRQAKKYLKAHGLIFLEFDPSQAEDIVSILKAEKYASWEILEDRSQRKRFARIVK
jgi:release factor glutamine methyltransferase